MFSTCPHLGLSPACIAKLTMTALLNVQSTDNSKTDASTDRVPYFNREMQIVAEEMGLFVSHVGRTWIAADLWVPL